MTTVFKMKATLFAFKISAYCKATAWQD